MGIAEFGPYAANEFLQHVTANTCAGIDDCHDEQCFEHDAEMIPVTHERIKTRDVGEDECHADSQRYSTARTMGNVFTNHCVQLRQIDDLHAESIEMFGCGVDSKVIIRNKGCSCDESHHSYERFGQHSAITDRNDGAFVHQHLRSCTSRNHAMETGNSTAGDGDEDVRKNRASDDRAAASAELGQGRHLDGRADDDNADSQSTDSTDFHVRGEVITRSQEQPYRKSCGDEAVDDQGDINSVAADGENRSQCRRSLYSRTSDNSQQCQDDTDDRAFLDFARTEELHVNTNEQSDRNRHADGECTPGAVMQGVGNNNGHTSHSEDIQEQYGKGRSQTCLITNLGFCDFSDGFAIVPHGAEEDNTVMDSTGENTTDEDPQGTGQIPELGSDDRAYERASTSDSSEVMTKYDVLIRRYIVMTIFETEGRCDIVLVDRQDFGTDESAVEPVSQYEH